MKPLPCITRFVAQILAQTLYMTRLVHLGTRTRRNSNLNWSGKVYPSPGTSSTKAGLRMYACCTSATPSVCRTSARSCAQSCRRSRTRRTSLSADTRRINTPSPRPRAPSSSRRRAWRRPTACYSSGPATSAAHAWAKHRVQPSLQQRC